MNKKTNDNAQQLFEIDFPFSLVSFLMPRIADKKSECLDKNM